MFSVFLLYLFSKYLYENVIKHLKFKKPTVSTDTNEHNSNDCDDLDKLSNYDECGYKYGYKTPLEWYRPKLNFYTPVSIQRYDAVFQVLNDVNEETKLQKVVDFGCASLDFICYLRRVKYLKEIMCVDIDREVLKDNIYKARPESVRWHDKSKQFIVKICEGSVTYSDIQLQNTDAVTCIELIEHLYPNVLIDLPYNIFGYIKPKVAVMTTPNADFNVFFRNFGEFRHPDHKFEWTRKQFQDWAENIVVRYPDYQVTFCGIGDGPVSTRDRGSCTQMAIFRRYDKEHEKQSDSKNIFSRVLPSDFPSNVAPLSLSNNERTSCRPYKILGTFYYPYKTEQNICQEKLLNNATKLIHEYVDCTDIPSSIIKLSDLMLKLKFREDMKTEDSYEYTEKMLESVLTREGWDIINTKNGRVLVMKLPIFNSNTGKDSFNNTYSINVNQRVNNTSTNTNDEYVLLPNPYHHNSNDELSIIIPQNDLVEQENANLSHKEDSVNEHSDDRFGEVSFSKHHNKKASINTDSMYYYRSILDSSTETEIQSTPSPKECTSLETTVKTSTGISNFLPHLSVSLTSTSPEPLLLNSSELKNSFLDYSLENYLNGTYNKSTMECEKDISMEESTTEDVFTCNEISFDNNSIQEDEINSYKPDYFEANNSHNIEQDKNSDITPLNTYSNFFNNQPKFTSSPNNKSHINSTSSSISKQRSSECEISTSLINSSSSPSSTRNVKKKVILSYSSDCDNTIIEVKQTCKVPSIIGIENTLKLSTEYANTADTNIYLKEKTDDFMQSDVNEKSLNLSLNRELSNLKSQDNSKYSYFESTKESDILENDTFVSCTDDETTSSNQSTSVLKDERKVESVIKNPIIINKDKKILNIAEFMDNNELEPCSPPETPNNWSPEIIDSGYPNSASAQDITPEYEISSIDQEYIPDSESPSVAEVPRLGVLEPIEVENGDLANNNRDGEGNNMLAANLNDLEDLQPLIDVLENDLENENDIYVLQNGFPLWLLRILNNPLDFDIPDMRILNVAGDAQYIDHDEGFEIENDNENDE